MFAYQGVRNFCFSGNFAYVLHEWSQKWTPSMMTAVLETFEQNMWNIFSKLTCLGKQNLRISFQYFLLLIPSKAKIHWVLRHECFSGNLRNTGRDLFVSSCFWQWRFHVKHDLKIKSDWSNCIIEKGGKNGKPSFFVQGLLIFLLQFSLFHSRF